MEKITKKLAEHASAALSKPIVGRKFSARKTVHPTNILRTTKPLKAAEFLPFADSGIGGFPYYYINPNDQRFNDKTYRWISAACSIKSERIELGAPFINTYIEALSSISFELSSADKIKLEKYQADINTNQLQLVQTWQQTYPAQNNAQIDTIIEIITNTWASPATNLNTLLHTSDLHGLLNQTPASGQAILTELSSYLNSINSAVSLQNSSSMHTGYVATALAAAQEPSNDNGGLQTTANIYRPKYTIATSLNDILLSLNSPNAGRFTMNVEMKYLGDNQCKTVIDGEPSEQTDITQVLDLRLDNITSFNQLLGTNDNVSATMVFTGVSIVDFSPQDFDKSGRKYWYWNAPIAEAIANQNSDTTGYRFSPKPAIDFSNNGKFGFLTSAAISKHPGVILQITSNQAVQVKQAFEQAQKITLNFVGRQMVMSNTPQISIVDDKLTVTLVQADYQQPDSIDSTAFVLGVKACFPNTTNC